MSNFVFGAVDRVDMINDRRVRSKLDRFGHIPQHRRVKMHDIRVANLDGAKARARSRLTTSTERIAPPPPTKLRILWVGRSASAVFPP